MVRTSRNGRLSGLRRHYVEGKRLAVVEKKGAAPPVMGEGAAEGVSYEAARSGWMGTIQEIVW